MEVRVLKANEAHYDRITECWSNLMRLHQEIDSQFFVNASANTAEFRQGLKYYSNNSDIKLLLVLEVEERIEGFISANIHSGFVNYNTIKYCEIEDIIVNDHFKGLGFGKLLIQGVLDWSNDQSVERVRLSVFGENKAALSFFKVLGFKEKFYHLELETKLSP